MARIRSIKPGFFKHDVLFDAEKASGLPLRVAFAGMWTIADREGRFKWQPRVIKVDVLPYDEVDFAAVLDALADVGLLRRYTVAGKEYGLITGFKEHQHVNKNEAPSTLPPPDDAKAVAAPSHDGERTIKEPSSHHEEGKGREQEGKGREEDSELRSAEASLEKQVFDVGKLLLGEKSGGLLAKLRKKIGDDGRVLELLELSRGKSSPREFLGACLREAKPQNWPHPDSHGRIAEFVDGKTLFAIGRDVVGQGSDEFVKELIGAVGGQMTKAAEVLLWRREKPPDWWEKVVSAVRCGEGINAPSDIYPRHSYQ